ncbi:hypothetical protein [uncultured Kordia sp.]|uniref:hypothetical protein n=1 Tax=uncultured Kordia sp. TaxID=507699 RepID=UPI00262A217A|nr:hypothetical protein [uncultured Kordia sp.]
MYAYEYGLKNFNEIYKPYNRITLFNDNIKIEDDTIGGVEGLGIYVKVTLDDNITTASVVYGESYQQYSTSFFEDYLAKINGVTITEHTRTINGLPNQIDRPIAIYNDEYYAHILDADELQPIAITVNKPQKITPFEETRKKVLAPILFDLDELLAEENISIIIMISNDGFKLEQAFDKLHTPLENEIVIFIENDLGSNLFGTVFRARFGNNIQVKKLKKEHYSTLTYLCKLYNVSVTTKQFEEIITESFEDRNYYHVNKVHGVFSRIPEWSMDLTAKGLDKITELIHVNLRSNDINTWKAHDNMGKENPNFDPFLYGYSEIKKMEATNEKALKDLTADIMLSKFNEDISKLELELDNSIDKLQIKQLKSKARAKLKGVYDSLTQAKIHVKEVTETALNELKHKYILVKVVKNIYLHLNAYIIGLYNSLVDFVTGIIQLISMLLKGMAAYERLKRSFKNNTSQTFSMFFELYENFLEVVYNLFSLRNITAFIAWNNKQTLTVIANILYPEKVKNKTKSYLASISVEQYGYAIGYLTGFIISEVLFTLVTGGVSTIQAATRATFKGYYDLLRGIIKAPVTVTKGVIKVGKFSINLITRLFKNLKKVAKQLPELLKKLDNWIDDLLKAANKYIDTAFEKLFPSKAARDKITNAGLKPTKVNDAGNAITFCPIK